MRALRSVVARELQHKYVYVGLWVSCTIYTYNTVMYNNGSSTQREPEYGVCESTNFKSLPYARASEKRKSMLNAQSSSHRLRQQWRWQQQRQHIYCVQVPQIKLNRQHTICLSTISILLFNFCFVTSRFFFFSPLFLTYIS